MSAATKQETTWTMAEFSRVAGEENVFSIILAQQWVMKNNLPFRSACSNKNIALLGRKAFREQERRNYLESQRT